MRRMKRWAALMLAVVISLSDCGGMNAFAAGESVTAEETVVVNEEEELQAGEDDQGGNTGAFGVVTDREADAEIDTNADTGTSGNTDTNAEDDVTSDTDTNTFGNTDTNADKTAKAQLPALHIGQIRDGEKLSDPEDLEATYDRPVSLQSTDSVILFVNYQVDGISEKEETGMLVWSILRGKRGLQEGSASLLQEEDDWKGFEMVADAPYFTMTEKETDGDCCFTTVELAAADYERYAAQENDGSEEGYRNHEDDNYYIRAAYYLTTAGGQEKELYAAATVPVLTGKGAEWTQEEMPDAEETSDIEASSEQESPGAEDTDLVEEGVLNTDADGLDEDALSDSEEDVMNEDEAAEADGMFTTLTEDAETSLLAARNEMQLDAEVTEVTGLTLDKSSIDMKPGDTVKVTAMVEPADMQDKIVWRSSDKNVAIVEADGEVMALAEGKAQITAQCGDKSALVKVEVVREDTDKLVDLSGDIWVAGFEQESDALVYTGQKVTQNLRVYYKDIPLQEKTDYTLTYKNNINAAAYNAVKAPSVTINLKGQYSGSRTLYYTIRPMDISGIEPYNAAESSSPGYEQTIVYSKTLKIPNPDLKFGKIKLKVNKDFVCDYTPYGADVPGTENIAQPMPENYKSGDSYEPGTVYGYQVNGTGNFTGSFQMRLVVVKNKNLNFGSAAVALNQKQYEYHGAPLTKADVGIASVKMNGRLLEESLYDYEVCAEALTGAYVTIYPSEAGRDAGYRGSKKVSLKLVGDRNLNKDVALGAGWQGSMFFSQKALEEEGGLYQKKTGVLTFGTGEAQETLTEGQDYTVKYSNAKKVGKVTVTFTGIGRYKGSLKKQYQIVANTEQMSYRLVWGKNVKQKDGELTVAYIKGGASPEFTLKDSDNYILNNKTDYTVKLKNNTVPGNTMSCEITGKGNYKGYNRIVELKVTAGDISEATMSVPDKPYSTKANAWQSKVTLKDVNGKLLAAGKDYAKEIAYQYEGMESGQPPAAGSTVTVTLRGMGCYEGSEITGTYRIYQDNISKLKITIDAQEYTGGEITLTPGWETNGNIHVYANANDQKKKQNEIMEPCYEIVGYKNNIKVGTAQVTLRGIDECNGKEYGGTKTYSFKIQKRKYQINHVKKITLDQTNLSVRLMDKKVVLTATLEAEEPGKKMANTTILWSTSNSKIATVATEDVDSSAAMVTFKKEGSVTITATAQDGNKKAQCKITIVNVPLLKEAGQTIEGNEGETYQLTVEWEESQAASGSLKWSSNNPDRVSVNGSGLITMKKTGAAVITLQVGNSKDIQQCNVVVKGEEEKLPEGNYITYEQKPGTVDDAVEINKLLRVWEWNPGKCDYLYIPAGVYHIGATITQENGFGGIVLTDNQKLVMSPGALLVAIGNNSSNYRIIYAFDRDNVTITGGQIIGDRDIHTGKGGEAGHGIQIDGCTNVHISDVEISKCWGDGIYLGAYSSSGKPSCDGVTIENCNLHHNRRSNLSITDANNVTIDNCQFNYASGTDPQYGIDIEYNYRTTEHVKISNSTFKGNAKASMGIIKGANDIRLENCTLDGNFYNMAGKNVVLKNTTIKGEIVDRTGGIRRE